MADVVAPDQPRLHPWKCPDRLQKISLARVAGAACFLPPSSIQSHCSITPMAALRAIRDEEPDILVMTQGADADADADHLRQLSDRPAELSCNAHPPTVRHDVASD